MIEIIIGIVIVLIISLSGLAYFAHRFMYHSKKAKEKKINEDLKHLKKISKNKKLTKEDAIKYQQLTESWNQRYYRYNFSWFLHKLIKLPPFLLLIYVGWFVYHTLFGTAPTVYFNQSNLFNITNSSGAVTQSSYGLPWWLVIALIVIPVWITYRFFKRSSFESLMAP